MLNKLIILTLIISFTSCLDNRQRRKDIVAEKIVIINENRTEWENLTKDILNDLFVNQKLGKLVSPTELNFDLKNRLLKQGILRLSVNKYNNCMQVEYDTDWTDYPIGALNITWTTCDSIQTQKGFYLDNFNINFIEVWGVGNNWLIWTDSDFK